MIIAVTSWRGIGASTTALALAACFAEKADAWLVEADPAGGALAGRMRFASGELGGLERVAFPVGHLTPLDSFDSVAAHRGRLRIVAAPADPFRACACHSPRVPWSPALRDLGGAVVVDVGRTTAGGPARPLLAMADTVLVVTVPEVSAVVASAEFVRSRARVSPADVPLDEVDLRVAVVDAPGGVGFGRHTLEADLADVWAGWLPWDPSSVDAVQRGALPGDRALRHSSLLAAARRLAASLAREEVLG